MKQTNLITVVILLAITSCQNNSSETKSGDTAKTETSSSRTETSSSGSVYKYEDLYTEYQKDYSMGEDGNKKMDGTQVLVKDKITGIADWEDIDKTKGIQIGFGSQGEGQFSGYKLVAYFTGAEIEKVKALKEGDEISFGGKIKDYKFGTLSLENCSLK